MDIKTPQIAVAIPCYNEAVTIVKVVRDFRMVLPHATIYVFDNNSTDGSAMLAEKAGALVYYVRNQGKGNVMRAIFENVVADAIIVVDGDDTYFAEEAPILLESIFNSEADMVVGNRLPNATQQSLKWLHKIGNRLIVGSINQMFGTSYADILSGYRIFSRRFIEYVPLLMPGFETETELTLQALENNMIIKEIPISYRNRPENSHSKLRTFSDGFRIMSTAMITLRDHNPMKFFGILSLISLLIISTAASLRIMNYLNITNIPSQLLTGFILLFTPVAVMTFGIGIILSSIKSRFKELQCLMMRHRRKQ